MNVTSFNFYFFQRHNRVPPPQVRLDERKQYAPTFADLVVSQPTQGDNQS